MRIAIVGCGLIAQVHARSISRIEGMELVAASDCKPERAVAMTKEYGGRPYDNLETMLKQEKPDVLHICTPHYLHTPMAITALRAGIHVFMEKPPVISFKQLEQLKKAVEETKDQVQLGICFQNRYNDSVQLVKKMLLDGKYGKVLGVRGIVNWFRSEEYYTDSDWRGRLETEGGGALMNQSVHTLDLIQYLVNEKPLEVHAVIDNQHLSGRIEVEDTMAAYIRYQDVTANFYVSTSYVDNAAPLVEVACEQAVIRIEDNRVFLFYKDGTMETQELARQRLPGKSYWGSSHEICIRDFYGCVARKTPFSLGLSALEPTIWLMLKAYESARSK